jgi:hypothetical protein
MACLSAFSANLGGFMADMEGRIQEESAMENATICCHRFFFRTPTIA